MDHPGTPICIFGLVRRPLNSCLSGSLKDAIVTVVMKKENDVIMRRQGDVDVHGRKLLYNIEISY